MRELDAKARTPRDQGQPRGRSRGRQRIRRTRLMPVFSLLILSLALLATAPRALAQSNKEPNPYQDVLNRLHSMSFLALPDWRAHADDLPHGENPVLDDAAWKPIRVGEAWNNGAVWFRRQVEIPPSLGGYSLEGRRVRLDLHVQADGASQVRVFFNGSLVEMGPLETQQPILVSEHAKPGEKILVAINVPAAEGEVRLTTSQLLVDQPAGRAGPEMLREEILSTQALLAGFPEGRAERGRELDAAVKAIDFGPLDRGDRQGFEKSLEVAQSKLQPLGEWEKQFTVRAVGNAHIDMAWLWPWTETVEVVRDTFGTVLQLMREYPGFTYAQSSAQAFAWMEEKYPAMFHEIQQRVKEGRWELVGGMWVEPDLNLPCGESLVRQLLVGMRYFHDKFGVNIKIGWNPDSFGYNWQLPQIYKRSGIDYFVTQKMAWSDTTKIPYKLFWWESPDGSRVLTYFPHDYVNSIEPVRISQDVATYVPSTHFPEIMHLYGIGDHGGGPTRSMLDSALRWENPKAVFPRLTFSTAQSFFDDVDKNLSHLKLPVWDNELYLQYHRGTYTTQSETKRRVRKSEELLLNAEKFSSLAMLDGRTYPQQQFEDSWKRLLFEQFHDILPGSGIAQNYVDAARSLGVVGLTGHKIMSGALGTLAARISTEGAGVPVVLFNSLSWPRTDVTEVKVQFPSPVSAVEVRDAKGEILPSAIEGHDDATHTLDLRFIARSVPAMGYEVVHVVPVTEAPAASTLKVSDDGMENEFIRLRIDPKTGCITSLVDKKDGRETLAPGACANLLQAFEDKPKEYDAWNINPNYEQHGWDLMDAEDVKLVENTPARAVFRVRKRFQNSSFVQDICMYPGVPRVDVHMQANWHEKHIMLKVAFPVSVESSFATYEIPYGTIQRPTTRNTPEQRAMFEVPALRWGDLSDSSHGFSLLNASKYGYDAKGQVIRLTLLRSPTWPDPHADQGFHEFTYALYPHAAGWREAQTERRGYELNYPLIPVAVEAHQGALPARDSFVEIEPANVILTAVKKAEDSDGLVFRFYEFEGKNSEVTLKFPRPATRAVSANLMEKDAAPLSLEGNGREVTVPIHPYEIMTVKAWFGAKTRN